MGMYVDGWVGMANGMYVCVYSKDYVVDVARLLC